MILHGIDTPLGIRHDNTLATPYRDYGDKDRVPVIATNPPFGGMEEDGIENNFPSHLRTRETADLFMALIIKLLRTGGRAAVVLPDGFLFGEGVKRTLKQQLLEECNLHTIVRMPNGVFAPYTSIKTNILFFKKGTPTKQVWFYEHPYPATLVQVDRLVGHGLRLLTAARARDGTATASSGAIPLQQHHAQREHQCKQAGGKHGEHEPETERHIGCRPSP